MLMSDRTRWPAMTVFDSGGCIAAGIPPRLRGPLREAYPVREISLGRNAPTRQIAFVCRAADADNRRVAAVREAFEHIYEPA